MANSGENDNDDYVEFEFQISIGLSPIPSEIDRAQLPLRVVDDTKIPRPQ